MAFPALRKIPKRFQPFVIFIMGCLTTLALPPIGFIPMLWITIPAFIYICHKSPSKKSAFFTGWLFGAGYFITGLYWISAALFVDIAQWAWVLPLSLIVGPGVLGIFWALPPLILHRFQGKDISVYALMFINIWMIVEYGRGHLFTGFPWNLIGYAWDPVLPIMQINAVVGIYGLSLLTLFWVITPLFRHRHILMVISIMTFVMAMILGVLRMRVNPTAQNDNHVVRIVQPNIAQNEKWLPNKEREHFEKQLRLTSAPFVDGMIPTFIIWPETAVAADLRLHPQIAHMIASHMPPNAHAVLGGLRITQKTNGDYNYFNSVSILNQQGQVTGVYDKHHLVPFGEYIPYRHIFNITPLANAISGIGDFTKGEGIATLSPDILNKKPPLSPLVCYEAIFPHAVVDQDNRPEWMVNVTNDGWYGKTSGPYQHLAITRVRAIEEGIPLIRAANTGISAIIDPVGRIVAKSPLGENYIVDGVLPKNIQPTLYSMYGDILFLLVVLLLNIPVITPISLQVQTRNKRSLL